MEPILALRTSPRTAEHVSLDALVGVFEVTLRFRESPDAEPLVTYGLLTAHWSEDGSNVSGTYRGEFAGLPAAFEVRVGYDERVGAYLCSWDREDGRVILPTAMGHGMDVGERVLFLRKLAGEQARQVLWIEGPDEHVQRVYGTSDAGEEYLRLELVHQRR